MFALQIIPELLNLRPYLITNQQYPTTLKSQQGRGLLKSK